MIFQSLVTIVPWFFDFKKTITESPGKHLKKLRQPFVAISMLNKWAKFHGDSLSG